MLVIQKCPFHTPQRAVVHAHPLPGSLKRPRLGGKLGCYDAPDSGDLTLLHRNWNLADSIDEIHTRSGQDGQPVVWIPSAEKIARKRRQVELLDAVRPTASALVERQKLFVAFVAKSPGG